MKKFFVGVKGVIVQDEQVLLLRHRKIGWDSPGGRIDGDESIPQALDRELREELPNLIGYKLGRLLYAQRLHKDVQDEVSLVLVLFEITNTVFDGAPQISHEHECAEWVPIKQAMSEVDGAVLDALRLLVAGQ